MKHLKTKGLKDNTAGKPITNKLKNMQIMGFKAAFALALQCILGFKDIHSCIAESVKFNCTQRVLRWLS